MTKCAAILHWARDRQPDFVIGGAERPYLHRHWLLPRMRYHASGGQWSDLRDPMTTITTHDRLALVTVWLKGEPWVIVDITLRMLAPRELYNAQDFPASYVIDRTASGKTLTKTAQVRMCGNSVSPLPMRLIVAANYSDVATERKRAVA